jgi:hypothetical protein
MSELSHDKPHAKQVAYLAGPMRGIPEYNFPAFYAAAAALRQHGLDVWSPAENDVNQDGFDPAKDTAQPMRHYMRRDLPAVLDADMVCVLPGWEKSQGAQLEVHVARACGIPVYNAHDLSPASTPSHARRLPCGTPESEMPNSSPCCGEYDKCVRACTPRGEWIASQRTPSTTPQKPGDLLTREHDKSLRGAAARLALATGFQFDDCALDIQQVCNHILAKHYAPSAIARSEDPGTVKILTAMVERAYGIFTASGVLRVAEQDPNSNDPIVAWASDVRSILYRNKPAEIDTVVGALRRADGGVKEVK